MWHVGFFVYFVIYLLTFIFIGKFLLADDLGSLLGFSFLTAIGSMFLGVMTASAIHNRD